MAEIGICHFGEMATTVGKRFRQVRWCGDLMQPGHFLTQLSEYAPGQVSGDVSIDVTLQHDRFVIVQNHNRLFGWYNDCRGANTMVGQIDQQTCKVCRIL